jgi:drug/metabolite transporter (DMT)-like permease
MSLNFINKIYSSVDIDIDIDIYIDIIIWFITSYFFTIYNKKILTLCESNDILIGLGILQLGIGIIYGIIYWIISNKKITLTLPLLIYNLHWKKYILIGFYSVCCHICSIYSIQMNTLTFNQIIKATEPIFYICFQYILGKYTFNIKNITYMGIIIFGGFLTSLVIVDGLIIFNFNYVGLLFGLGSNIFSCLKSIQTKSIIQTKINDQYKLDKEDILLFNYNLINIFTFLLGIPIWCLIGDNIFSTPNNKILFDYVFVKYLITTGITFYIYGYYSIMISNKINPINQLILGTIKRIIIIGISIILFHEELTYLKLIGLIFCIVGIVLNSIDK